MLHVFFESQEEARFVALGFASRAHVLAPLTLRDEVMQEMSAAVARLANRCVAQLIRKIPSVINMTFESGRFGHV